MSANGRKQAQQAGAALREHWFDHIYASDLTRACDTAEIIAKTNVHHKDGNGKIGHGVVETTELLRERCFGPFEMRPSRELEAAAKEAGFDFEANKENIYNFTPEEGESITDVRRRAIEFLDMLGNKVVEKEILEKSKQNDINTFNVLVVSHGGYLRQLTNYLFFDCECKMPQTPDNRNDEKMKVVIDTCVGNTAISQFQLQINCTTAELVSAQCTQFGCVQHLQT